MQNNFEYQSYVNDVKNLDIFQSRQNYQAPYKEDFEKIYSNVLEQNIELLSAKDFIQNLSKDELQSLQKYNGLAEAIDTSSLSAEAAYNLLLHDYEQYDFDNDGLTQVGAANIISVIPRTMPSDVRVAYIQALNSLDEKEKLMAMSLTFDMGRISALINKSDYSPKVIDYEYLSEQVEARLNPQNMGFSSSEFKVATEKFWEAFENSYEGKRVEKEEKRDEAIIEFIEKLKTQGASGFLAQLNKEKIEEKIQELKEELIKQMGDSATSMAKIEDLLSQFRKELLEQMQISLDNNEEGQNIDTQSMIKILFELKAQKQTPFEKLLQEKS